MPPKRPIVPPSADEVAKAYSKNCGVNLTETQTQTLKPIVACFIRDEWVDQELVAQNLKTMGVSMSVARLETGKQTLLDVLDSDKFVRQSADGGTSFSPDGLMHVMLQLPGTEGNTLRALFSENTGASLMAVVHSIGTERQDIRNDNANFYVQNTQAIVDAGIADPMFGAREEARIYRNTVGSTDAALTQLGYTSDERTKLKKTSLRTAVSKPFGSIRKTFGLIQQIAVQNHVLPGGTLADKTPQEMRGVISAINDSSVNSYNAPRPTIEQKRADAFVPRR